MGDDSSVMMDSNDESDKENGCDNSSMMTDRKDGSDMVVMTMTEVIKKNG